MIRHLAPLLLLTACGARIPVEDSDPVDSDTTPPAPVDTAPEWPLWQYSAAVSNATSEFLVDGAPLLTLAGQHWNMTFGGPTLVAEADHEVQLQIVNEATTFELEVDGVEVVLGGTFPASNTAALVFRTTQGPGNHIWRARDPEQVGRGIFGLVTIRDEAEFPVADLDEQVNLVVVDVAASAAQLDRCAIAAHDTAAACPDWGPVEDGYGTVLIAQRLIFNPDAQAPYRHGGLSNEFRTSTVGALVVKAGSDVRVNFGNVGETAHTLSLGGLRWTDVHGETVEQVVVEPGKATHRTFAAVDQPGEYVVHCLDHDHHGLDRIVLRVE